MANPKAPSKGTPKRKRDSGDTRKRLELERSGVINIISDSEEDTQAPKSVRRNPTGNSSKQASVTVPSQAKSQTAGMRQTLSWPQPHTPQTPSSQTPSSQTLTSSSSSRKQSIGSSVKRSTMKTAVKSETEPAQPSKAPANDKRNKKELLSCLLEQENANSNLEKQLKGMQKENTGLQEQHADASSIIGRKDHEAAQLLQQTKNNAIEIGQLQQENSELRDQILTTGQLEDQVTDDELKRKMRELASSITRWVVNHLSTTELKKDVGIMTKAVEDVVSRMVPGVEQLSGLPKTHLLRALLAGQMLELFKAPLFLPSHASSAAVQKLWTDIKRTSPQSVEQQALDWSALTHRLIFGLDDDEHQHFYEGLVQPIIENIESTVRTLLQFKLPETSMSSLRKLFVEAVKLVLTLRKQRTECGVGLADDVKTSSQAMLDCTGSEPVAEGRKIRLIVFPALLEASQRQEVRGAIMHGCERAMGALRRRKLVSVEMLVLSSWRRGTVSPCHQEEERC